MKNIRVITSDIPYKIIWSDRRRTSKIQVGEDGIQIRVPTNKKHDEIMDMINSRKLWICKKYLEFQTKKERFKIRVDRSYIIQRVNKLATKIGVKPSRISTRPLKTRWSSATANGAITINSRLCRAPKGVIDYVIIHELCHLRISGHSAAYWNMVSMYMPKYGEKIEWLKKHGRFI